MKAFSIALFVLFASTAAHAVERVETYRIESPVRGSAFRPTDFNDSEGRSHSIACGKMVSTLMVGSQEEQESKVVRLNSDISCNEVFLKLRAASKEKPVLLQVSVRSEDDEDGDPVVLKEVTQVTRN